MDDFTIGELAKQINVHVETLRSTSDAGRALWDSFIGFGFVVSASQFQCPAAVTFQPNI